MCFAVHSNGDREGERANPLRAALIEIGQDFVATGRDVALRPGDRFGRIIGGGVARSGYFRIDSNKR